VTGELWQLNALCTAVAAGMFKLGGTGFDAMKALAVSHGVALLLRLNDGGFSVDTVKANKVQAVTTLTLLFLAFVD
jgi:hypothetical protein